jgi:hypothetical protein
VLLDGGREYGWHGHEAALLPPAVAAKLFAQLLAKADTACRVTPPGVRVPGARVGELRLATVRSAGHGQS